MLRTGSVQEASTLIGRVIEVQLFCEGARWGGCGFCSEQCVVVENQSQTSLVECKHGTTILGNAAKVMQQNERQVMSLGAMKDHRPSTSRPRSPTGL